MARVTIEDCIKKISNPFDLVLYASQRSKELNQGEPTDLDKGNDKNTVSRIGAKIKRPTPGANSIPNDEDKMYEIGLTRINPPNSEPTVV